MALDYPPPVAPGKPFDWAAYWRELPAVQLVEKATLLVAGLGPLIGGHERAIIAELCHRVGEKEGPR